MEISLNEPHVKVYLWMMLYACAVITYTIAKNPPARTTDAIAYYVVMPIVPAIIILCLPILFFKVIQDVWNSYMAKAIKR